VEAAEGDGVSAKLWLKKSPPPAGQQQSSVTQFGITWTFDQEYEVGQYVNGDWWVVGPVDIIEIDPAWDGVNGRHGGMLNPDDTQNGQGYDNQTGPGNDHTENFDIDLVPQPPLTLQPGDSLVSARSENGRVSGKFTYLLDAAILTCVDEAQAAHYFRPPYCRGTRVSTSASDPYRFSSSGLDPGLLPALSSVAGTPTLSSTETRCRVGRPVIDHWSTYKWTRVAPINNMNDYGQRMTEDWGEGFLQLCLDYTDEQKLPLVRHFVQQGIDILGALSAGMLWFADGGIMQGRKMPLVFAGKMLGDTQFATAGVQLAAADRGTQRKFQEENQCYHYEDADLPDTTDVDFTQPGPHACAGVKGQVGIFAGNGGSIYLWRIRQGNGGASTYLEHEHIPPEDWNPDSNYQQKVEDYRCANTSASWVNQALAARLMELVADWDHASYFGYVDRWMTEDDSAWVTEVESHWPGSTGSQARQGESDTFTENMWAAYR